MAEQSAPIAPLQRVLQWGPSVCQIQAPNDSGTGFLVAPNLIMTCAHVIATAEKAKNAYAHFSNKTCVKLNPDGFFYSQPCYQGKTLIFPRFCRHF